MVMFPCEAAKCNNEVLISSFDNFLCANISITVWRSCLLIASISDCLIKVNGIDNGARNNFCSYLSRIHRSRSDLKI
jgi:hypothetical protein